MKVLRLILLVSLLPAVGRADDSTLPADASQPVPATTQEDPQSSSLTDFTAADLAKILTNRDVCFPASYGGTLPVLSPNAESVLVGIDQPGVVDALRDALADDSRAVVAHAILTMALLSPKEKWAHDFNGLKPVKGPPGGHATYDAAALSDVRSYWDTRGFANGQH